MVANGEQIKIIIRDHLPQSSSGEELQSKCTGLKVLLKCFREAFTHRVLEP